MKSWIRSMISRTSFYSRGTSRARKDSDVDWRWFRKFPTAHLVDARRVLKPLLKKLGIKGLGGFSVAWLEDNSNELWETRNSLADELSRECSMTQSF